MITYCTAIWTHHQAEVCKELHKILGDEFKMVLTLPLDAPVSKERIAMGWDLTPPDDDWIVGPPKTAEEARGIDYRQYIVEPDVTVLGWTPEVPARIIMKRVRSGKLTFFQSERLFKQKPTMKDWLNPFYLKWRFSLWRKLHPKNVHFLTLSHWCAEDLVSLHVCRGRTWKWGYLTKVSPEMPQKDIHNRLEIGWCGRMLPLKRVNTIIDAIARMPDDIRQKCHVTLVGDGEAKDDLVDQTAKLGLGDLITFCGHVSASEAIKFMKGLDVFVFPSNRLEGWGAVVLESMNAGCAIVASVDAGAVLDVIENGVNGRVFNGGDSHELADIIEDLICHRDKCAEMGRMAWRTAQRWSPETGAWSLVKLIRALQSGNMKEIPQSGLCSTVR